MIGIIGAMDSEIEKIAYNLKDKELNKIEFLDFYTGKLLEKDIVIVKSNEGKVNSAIATQLMISNFDVDYIINVGIAGAIESKLKIYDVAIASSTVEFDFDVSALGYDKGYTFGVDCIYVKSSDSLSHKLKEVCNNLRLNSSIGIIASSDKFVTDRKDKEILNKNFNVIAVDMESASINHVCKLNNIPFVALRVISDTGDGIEYSIFSKKATDNIFEILSGFLLK